MKNHLRENTYLLSEGKIDDINNQLTLIEKFELDSRSIKWEEIVAGVAGGGFISFGIVAFTVKDIPNVLELSVALCIICLIVGILCIWFAKRARDKINTIIPLHTKHIREVIEKCKDSLINSNEI